MTLGRIFICGSLLGLLVSCANREPKKDRTPSIGQAYVGPTLLNLREDVNPKTPTVATLKHGDKLDIIENRRRFVKVRTEQGVVGWTDNHQLLLPEQMTGLERQAEDAKRMPSQGTASIFEALNMHADPNRTSPGFEQLKEGTKVDVLEHKLVPRVAPPPPPILAPIPKPKPTRRRSKQEKTKSGKIPPPPMPLAPLPPKNWVEMSRTEDEPEEKSGASAKEQAEPPKPIPLEDWYLVRTKDGKAGWVLSRMVSMAIPDEVAQYAEGHRITSYFSLGKVDDDGTLKDNWLWTTIQKGSEQYEFDSFRVFVWSRRHHRYETAYVQRDVVGHYPIGVDTSGENPSFSLVLTGDDGQLYKKTYVFNGYRVNLVNTERYVPGNPNQSTNAIAQNQNPDTGSWYSRMKDRVTKMFRR